jgi:PhzF family phenazine biosynthesis protein
VSGGPPLLQVDAFADAPFAGNPAAVCLLEEPAGAAWMQAVAAEMNLSETAFVTPRPDGDGFDLRWFTPAVEVDLCGHATLASAHALWETGRVAAGEPIAFHTRSGRLGATGATGLIALDFPATPAEPADPPPGLAEALGVDARWFGRNAADWLVEVGSPGDVVAAAPDLARLGAVTSRGVIVTAAGGRDG